MKIEEILEILRDEEGLSEAECNYLKAQYQYDFAAESTSMDYGVAVERGEAWKALAESLTPERRGYLQGIVVMLRFF